MIREVVRATKHLSIKVANSDALSTKSTALHFRAMKVRVCGRALHYPVAS